MHLYVAPHMLWLKLPNGSLSTVFIAPSFAAVSKSASFLSMKRSVFTFIGSHSWMSAEQLEADRPDRFADTERAGRPQQDEACLHAFFSRTLL